MAFRICTVIFTILVTASCLDHQRELNAADAENTANPIRRVVTMLQSMAKKIAAESEKEEQLYDKFMCYCKNAGSTLQLSIDAADTKIPQVESSLKEAEEKKKQLEQEVKDHQTARADAKASMATSTALREKEAAEFAKEKAEYDSNIGQLGGAIEAIEKGMSGFLQTRAAEMVKRLALNSPDLSSFDRQLLISFLSGASDQEYVPKSGEITGILKEMKDTMSKDLADITATEKSAISAYEDLMSAKTKMVQANTKAIEKKSQRVGELGVSIAEMKNDLDDTSAALLEDKKFLADMDESCEAKQKQWAEITKARAEENVAIQETIKILNDDDALELFKKTLPTPSFVQTVVNYDAIRRKVLGLVQQLQSRPTESRRVNLDMISMALSGKKVSFEKVIAMIDKMVTLLGQEQLDDDNKKEYCEKQLDFADDKKKSLQQDVKDLEATIEDAKESLSTLTEEIKSLGESVKELDKEVAESTETRKDEHAEYTELMSSDAAAKELLGYAKNRLNKYYNPKLYKPAPKRELSEEQRIYTNMGGELAPTAAPGGIAGTGVTALVQISEHHSTSREAPPPPPESFKAYAKKGEESTGVISMIDLLISDLDKEMTEAETAEKHAQKEYETFMSDAASKRAAESKSITDKEGYKAEAETVLQTAKEGQTAKVKELMATESFESALHAECDWLVANFEIRKEARAGEVESLKNAKAVLAGADFSLLQRPDARSLRR